MKKISIVFALLLFLFVLVLVLASCKEEQVEDSKDVTEASEDDNSANGENEQGLDFYLSDDGTYTVAIGKAKYLSSVKIPATYAGKPVTEIAYKGFSGGTAEKYPLKEIVISKNIKVINTSSFAYCGNLETVVFEEGSQLEKIDSGAFYFCANLKNILLPSTIKYIGDAAFYRCDSLELNEYDNAYYFGNNENPYLFLMKAQNTEISTCKINEKTICINQRAFYECTHLKEIIIPQSVSVIGDTAFGRSGLESIAFEAEGNTQYIGTYAFEYTQIKQLTIPDNVKTFSWGIFSDCSPMLDVVIPVSVNHITDSGMFGANNGGDPVGYVYYEGIQEEWNQIKLDIVFGDSFMLEETDIFFYSATKPEVSGNYWRYVDSVPTLWE